MEAFNQHRVPVRQWRKWSEQSRQVFNAVYETMREGQALFAHPDAVEVPLPQWEVTAWNAAWTAADAVKDSERKFREERVRKRAASQQARSVQ